MVSAYIYGYEEKLKIYILARPINRRMTFPETIEAAKKVSVSLGMGHPTMLLIEDVGYQASVVDELKKQGYPAEGVKVMGTDKRQRLEITAPLIANGNILFPKKGCEDLISQLVGFGYEAHDDLADVFAILVLRILKSSRKIPVITGDII